MAFDVTFRELNGGKGVLEILVSPHPVTGQQNKRVGYCQPGRKNWSLIAQHALEESHLSLLTIEVEKKIGLRTNADSAQPPATTPSAGSTMMGDGDGGSDEQSGDLGGGGE